MDSAVEKDGEGKPAKVRQDHLSHALAYQSFVYCKAEDHPGPAEARVRFITDRRRQTCNKAQTMYRTNRGSWDEAFTKALEDKCGLIWTIDADSADTKVKAIVGRK